VMEVLKKVEGLAFVHFDEADVVRHHLVQRIIHAYEEHKAKIGEQRPLPLSEESSGADFATHAEDAYQDARQDKKTGKLVIVREESGREEKPAEIKGAKLQEG
jgi:hypothetical protein